MSFLAQRAPKWPRTALFAMASLLSLPAAGATGRITDAASGKPVVGATVYAVWMERSMWTDRQGCGGDVVVTTDANGDYDIGLGMTLHTWMHDAVYWVVAPGYRGGGTYTSKSWSTALQPLDGLNVDDKLRAVPPSERYESCVSGSVKPYESMRKFERAIRAAQTVAMCDPGNADATPQSDVFMRYFPVSEQGPQLWRVFVRPLLPRQTSHPIPALARDNACALASVHEDDGPTQVAHPQLTGPLTLRVALKDMDENMSAQKVPVRLLWSTRRTQERLVDTEHRNLLPRHGAIAFTDADGNADFPVTQAMLDEQTFSRALLSPFQGVEFAAIPYAQDRFALDPNTNTFESRCVESDWLRFSPHLRTPGGVILVPGCALGRGTDPSEAGYTQLNDIFGRETKRRAGANFVEGDSSTLRIYAWQWPITALLTRAYDLITLPADVENDADALNHLQRAELTQALNAVCAQSAGLLAPNPRALLRSFWWLQVQTDGVDAANRNAQDRAMKWDNGGRCTYRDGKLISLGPTQPPNLLAVGEVCRVWQDIRPRLDAAPASKALPVLQMQVDFSRRQGACQQQPDFGSSL